MIDFILLKAGSPIEQTRFQPLTCYGSSCVLSCLAVKNSFMNTENGLMKFAISVSRLRDNYLKALSMALLFSVLQDTSLLWLEGAILKF